MRCWHHLHPKFVENFIFLTFPFTVLQLRFRNLILHQILIYLKKKFIKNASFLTIFHHFSIILHTLNQMMWYPRRSPVVSLPCDVPALARRGYGRPPIRTTHYINILILCVIQIGRLPYPLLARAGTSQGITRAGTPRGNGGDITSFDSNVCRIIENWWKIVKNYAFSMNFFLK